MDKGERIAKIIARAGLCSRREAEAWIAQGRVALDGKVLDSPAVTVGPEARITVDGRPLPAPEAARLWRYHKPRGQLTTTKDPAGRPTVYDALPEGLRRLMSIGRLDINSEGLLLFTNDGAVKRRLELPATGWVRRYRVRVQGAVDEGALARLAQGSTVDGIAYGPIDARLESAGRSARANSWLTMALKEGKNREIRRVCEHMGLRVNRLIRLSYGPFQLGNLAPGELREVPVKVVREQLGGPGAEAPGRGFAKAKARPGRRKGPQGRAKGKGHAHRRRQT